MSRRHSSKRKHRVLSKRRLRKAEKLSAATADKMMGRRRAEQVRGQPTIAEMIDG